MNTLQAIIIAIIEGLTEYLPISSTAHMGFTAALMGMPESEFLKMFQVSIQFGAILSIVVLYWKKFFDFKNFNFNFYIKLACAVIPALILGKLFDDKIEAVLGNQVAISGMLVFGGIILLFVDKWFKNPKINDEKDITLKQAIIIGFWQCLAMMPGTSRSAASIIGGMTQGLSRKAAAEFSFFLAVPTMLAVTVYSIFVKTWGEDTATPMKPYYIILNWKCCRIYCSINRSKNIYCSFNKIRFQILGVLQNYHRNYFIDLFLLQFSNTSRKRQCRFSRNYNDSAQIR